MFRTPVDQPSKLLDFYQRKYSQGLTTYLPSDLELAHLLKTRFQGTEKDFSVYVDIVASVAEDGAQVLDFGASWGYGSWQLARRGFDVTSYEISAPRRNFGQSSLGLNYVPSISALSNRFDVVFSSHVFEHIPAVRAALDSAISVLKDGGILVSFTPNGSRDFRYTSHEQWHLSWGRVHPILLDEQFLLHAYPDWDAVFLTPPYDLDAIRRWATSGQRPVQPALSGGELLFLLRKPVFAPGS